jgi:hypothetical protein
MIRGGDDDGVDVASGEQLTEVVVSGAAAVTRLVLVLGVSLINGVACGFAAVGIDVADSDDVAFFTAEDRSGEMAVLGAHADAADMDAAIGAGVGGPDVGREQEGSGRGGGGAEELAAGERSIGHKRFAGHHSAVRVTLPEAAAGIKCNSEFGDGDPGSLGP